MTNIDYMKDKFPSRLSDTAIGGVIGCPEDYGLSSLRDDYYCKNGCNKCWKLPVEQQI